MAIVLIVFVVQDFKTVSLIEWKTMLGSGVLCAGLGGFYFTKGIRRVPAFTANMIGMLEILFSPLWAFLIFHETIGIISCGGAVFIVSGIVFHLYRELKNVNIKEKRYQYD